MLEGNCVRLLPSAFSFAKLAKLYIDWGSSMSLLWDTSSYTNLAKSHRLLEIYVSLFLLKFNSMRLVRLARLIGNYLMFSCERFNYLISFKSFHSLILTEFNTFYCSLCSLAFIDSVLTYVISINFWLSFSISFSVSFMNFWKLSWTLLAISKASLSILVLWSRLSPLR